MVDLKRNMVDLKGYCVDRPKAGRTTPSRARCPRAARQGGPPLPPEPINSRAPQVPPAPPAARRSRYIP
eukprot:379222-Prorocentrum_minimum.AAC.2